MRESIYAYDHLPGSPGLLRANERLTTRSGRVRCLTADRIFETWLHKRSHPADRIHRAVGNGLFSEDEVTNLACARRDAFCVRRRRTSEPKSRDRDRPVAEKRLQRSAPAPLRRDDIGVERDPDCDSTLKVQQRVCRCSAPPPRPSTLDFARTP